jgi:hypothetical protein
MSRAGSAAQSVVRGGADTAGNVLGLLLGFVRWFFVGRVDGPSPEAGGAAPWLVPDVRARRSVQAWLVVRIVVLAALGVATAWAVLHPVGALLGLVALVAPSFVHFVTRARARARLLAEAAAPVLEGVSPRRSLPAPRAPASGGGVAGLFPTASLGALRVALERLRVGELAGALEQLDRVEPAHLRADELRLAEAARAWAALLAGDKRGAAARAVGAVPTGLAGIDAVLLPVCLANALHDAARLARLLDAWDAAHARWEASDEVDALRAIAMLKLGRVEPGAWPSDRVQALSERCRALGERELAAALSDAVPQLPGGYR